MTYNWLYNTLSQSNNCRDLILHLMSFINTKLLLCFHENTSKSSFQYYYAHLSRLAKHRTTNIGILVQVSITITTH